jgi:hypothetical protein
MPEVMTTKSFSILTGDLSYSMSPALLYVLLLLCRNDEDLQVAVVVVQRT